MSVRTSKWRRAKRQELLIKQNGRCCYCYEPLKKGTLEHIKPLSHGGTDEPNNLAVACYACNRAKGNMPIGKFKRQIKSEISIHWARRKIFLRGMRAEKRILAYVGITHHTHNYKGVKE